MKRVSCEDRAWYGLELKIAGGLEPACGHGSSWFPTTARFRSGLNTGFTRFEFGEPLQTGVLIRLSLFASGLTFNLQAEKSRDP